MHEECTPLVTHHLGLQAMKQERLKRAQGQAPTAVIAETEDAMVAVFIEGCRFDMQAGFSERAVASIQAALEYSCFAPAIPVGMPGTHHTCFTSFQLEFLLHVMVGCSDTTHN